MEGVHVTIQSVEECLIGLSLLHRGEIRRSLGSSRVDLLDGAFETEASDTSYEEDGRDLGNESAILLVLDCGLDHNDGCLTLVLEIDQLVLGDKDGVWLDGCEDLKALFAVEEHHGVEGGDAWNRKVFERHAMGDDDVHGWEALEFLGVLVGEVVMGFVQWVSLETNAQRV